MKRNGVNFVKLLKKYNKGWIAISSDFRKVLFHGNTLKETMKKAVGYDHKLYYFPAGEKYSDFVGQE